MSLNFIYYVKELRSSLTSGKPSAGAIASAEDLWNITNSEKNAESVLASGSTELLIEVIKKFITISKRGNNEFRLVEACLNAVYNCTRWDVFREFFSQHPEFLSLCELLFSSEFKEFVNLAEFSVCLIAGRDESGAGRELLKRCPNIISHAVDLLDRVVMAKEYESVDNTVWDPQEQCAILLNLSISDANKPSLTIAIPVMIKALEKRPNNEGMIKTILLSFQHLSFEPITLKLLQESVPRLEKATILCKLNSENSIQLKSLMSRLKPELAKQERKASATARRPSLLQTMLGIGAKGEKNAQPQIMISYNWAHQQTVKTIHSQLVAKGFKVWIDMEQMSGNIADKMAEAVENSDVVLMCISSKYKESANCRQEAEYALECKKPLVILMMEKGYKANGWLGLMVGRKLWVDCTDSKKP